MANHVRKQIRDRIVTLLGVSGQTWAASHVYANQTYALSQSAELPCLLMYMAGEEMEKNSLCSPGELARKITFSIEAVAAAVSPGPVDTLDQMTKEVEVLLFADPYLNNLAKGGIQLLRTEIQLEGPDAPKPTGVARMTWQIVTFTREGAPDAVV